MANQARQADITQEISEIVGGANALADAHAGVSDEMTMTATIEETQGRDAPPAASAASRGSSARSSTSSSPSTRCPSIYNALEVDLDLGERGRACSPSRSPSTSATTWSARSRCSRPTAWCAARRCATPAARSPCRSATSPRATSSTPSARCSTSRRARSYEVTERWAIHRKAPAVRPARVQDRDVRDRHQGHRPAHPVRARRQDRPVRRCRCRQDRADPGDDRPRRQELRWCVGVRRRRRAHP